MRRYLGEDEHAPIRHPAIVSALETCIMGVRLPQHKGGTAATIIPSVGCPMGCNFCTTSAFSEVKESSSTFTRPAMNYLKSCAASAYAPPAAPKATVYGAKLTALNGEVQRLLVTVLVLGVISAEYWSDLVGGLVRD